MGLSELVKVKGKVYRRRAETGLDNLIELPPEEQEEALSHFI